MDKKHTNKGFTIIELMIATTVFSVILLVTSAGVIAIGRAYYKSLTSTRVQGVARSVMDDISRSLQFSDTNQVFSQLTNPDDPSDKVKVRCFGSDRYRYVINQQVSGADHGLYRDKKPSASSCDSSGDYNSGSELLGGNMRLLQFDVLPVTNNPDTNESFRIVIKVAYGDDDLLNIYDDDSQPVGWSEPVDTGDEAVISGALCRSGIAGNNFCAVSGLVTTVTSRVK
jgi:prepilin-type N-terminal cleavage/methylation domain-containing protein